MEKYSTRALDELNRILLPQELRDKLELGVGDRVSLDIAVNLLVLCKIPAGLVGLETSSATLNDLGMITLSRAVCNELNWKTHDKLSIYHIDKLVILHHPE